MIRLVRTGLALAMISVAGLGAGCGSAPTPASPEGRKDNVSNQSFDELAQMLRIRQEGGGSKPIASAADLATYEKAFTIGYSKLKRGDIVFLFGAPVVEGASDKVLAYEKQAPDSGGYVLMQDGTTIKKLTAEEFKSAPKAGKG
jgi:hypothetical protein